MGMPTAISLAHVEEARRVIDPVFLNSPQFEADALSAAAGARIVLKVECMNPIRSFKGRGAEFFTHRRKDTAPAPWVCASAGNFGQGLGYSARKHDIPLVVYASTRANAFKIEKMKELGADVRLHGHDFDEAKEEARAYAERDGLTFVEDGRDVEITEGAATVAPEICERFDIDAFVVPVGNGALVNGVGSWMRAHASRVQVIGAGARGAPAMEQSFRRKRVVETETVTTFADGIATRVPVPEAVELMVDVMDDMLLVDDEAITRAMQMIERDVGLKVEPAGAATLAAVHEQRERFRDQTVGVLISGSNVVPSQ